MIEAVALIWAVWGGAEVAFESPPYPELWPTRAACVAAAPDLASMAARSMQAQGAIVITVAIVCRPAAVGA